MVFPSVAMAGRRAGVSGLRFQVSGECWPDGRCMEIQRNARSDGSPDGVVGRRAPWVSRIRAEGGNLMTPKQGELAQRRLLLGIANVGFWVVASIGGLAWVFSGRWTFDGVGAAAIGIVAVGLQAVFDGIGGGLLVPGTRPTLGAFLKGWGRGVCVHALVLAGIGAVAAVSLRWTGGFCTGLAASMVALALGRRFLHAAISGAADRTVPVEGGGSLLVTQVDDPAFTGGLVGFASRAGILVPEAWCQRLPQSDLQVELSRRRWRAEQRLPFRTLIVLMLWNLVGCQIGSITVDIASLTTGAALIGQACWMTLWSFLGLLVLPSLGRATVFAADRAAAAAGLDPSGWIRSFPTITGEDGSHRELVEKVFYPIPSAARRMESLRSPVGGPLLGDLARSQLYYSMAGLTLLGRAVHCNVGRPALWVFPPSA